MIKDTLIIQELITLIALVVSFLIGRYILPKIGKTTDEALKDMQILQKYAETFVVYARDFCTDLTGEDKLAEVITKLKSIATNINIPISDDNLKAIAQKAYVEMKKGEELSKAESENETK